MELMDGGAWGEEREKTSCSLCTFMHRARYLVYTDLNYGSLITINEVPSNRTG